MTKTTLLKKFLPGLLPLFVFILIDELLDTRMAILAAIGFGVLTLIYFWIKEKRFDKFTLFDTLLIALLGGVSLILDNDAFFKLKPALIGVIICAILGISAFTPKNFIFSMSKRYLGNMEVSEQQQKQLKQTVKALFFIFLIYTILVFYSVWFMSNKAWAFISGGLFYILFGAYALFEFGRLKYRQYKLNNQEWLPIVDNDGKVIGKAPRSVCHADKSLLHPVVHLHVFNAQRQLFLQKRPNDKLIQPGKWDTAVGGHIAFGETLEQSLERESFEEIGIKSFQPAFIKKYRWESKVESELVYCFVTQYNGALNTNEKELDGGKFWSFEEIKHNLGREVFTPNFEFEFNTILKKLRH